ncbi:MAG: DUF2075 domain-containing protein [Pyrinomonadaceae bacterium]
MPQFSVDQRKGSAPDRAGKIIHRVRAKVLKFGLLETHIQLTVNRYYYSAELDQFLVQSPAEILGILTGESGFSVEQTQATAWLTQIDLLKRALPGLVGRIYFEYSIPRLGRRIDVVLIVANVVFVLEFKVGDDRFTAYAVDQVWDYALDLKNFHETSHEPVVAPILIATEARARIGNVPLVRDVDSLVSPPLQANADGIRQSIDAVLAFVQSDVSDNIDPNAWDGGRYAPTPTIIEAATALYGHHSVAELSRADASARNLRETATAIRSVISRSQSANEKSICFVTGVPGAGKTLVGLDIAAQRTEDLHDPRSVFLSGNGPLVEILQEALTRDQVSRERERGRRVTKTEARRSVKKFIQIVHHYRDEYLKDDRPPYDHVAIFDEAQRAWNLAETASFMKRKKGRPHFKQSESEFLISCLDRHPDWAVIVCLIGGGQEINRGEAGIGEWIESINRAFRHWNVYISPRLTDSEYAAVRSLNQIVTENRVVTDDRLHLGVSMRSFRAENVSAFVKAILDLELDEATDLYATIKDKYPLVLTRDLNAAKDWLRAKARGGERYGILASSSAERLKAKGLNVKAPMNPVHWFLEGKEDVRSSYFLEDVATEFHCQGLELDWTCVAWDADLRYSHSNWQTYSFRSASWQNVNKPERKQFLKNAYRVLLTRARQGMVIVVPTGENADATRKPAYYDETYEYLKHVGLEIL